MHCRYAGVVRIARIAGGLVLAFAGAVWLLQGLNSTVVPQSFMTGSRLWVLIGAVAFTLGLAIAWRSWKRR